MTRSIPPRLRAPLILAIGALIVLAIGAATHGWNTVLYVLPVPIVLIVGYYILGARDNDTGALIRHELDERQAYERLKVQALVGRVLTVAVAVAYTVAWASNTKLWPWAALLGLMAISFIVGRLVYGPHANGHSDDELT